MPGNASENENPWPRLFDLILLHRKCGIETRRLISLSSTRPHSYPCLFISLSVLLCVLLSCMVIITSRSSNSFDSACLTDPQLAVLHASANGYLINLSLQVQLGESDKLGSLWGSALLSVYRKDELAMGRWMAGIGRVRE